MTTEKIREALSEVDISLRLGKLMIGEARNVTFENHYEPNFRIRVEYIKSAGYKFELEYMIPGLGYCIVRCNNVIGRSNFAVGIIKELINVSDLTEYECENTAKDILDMEIDSIRFLPEALINKELFGGVFKEFDKAVEEVFGRKKYVSDSIKSEESA